jgi:arginyl-tRNA synthetase
LDTKQEFAGRLNEAIERVLAGALAAPSRDEIAAAIQVPKELKNGDLSWPCFTLAKALKKPPPAIAAEIAAVFASGAPAPFSRIIAAGGYLNAFVDKAAGFGALLPKILDGSYLAPRPPRGERVMIEYSQPNTHKVFHVGHTRNVSLGDSLVRLSRFVGCDVVAANYIGDVGTHIAKCLWYFKSVFGGDRSKVPVTNRGAFLGSMYAEADKLLDLSALTRAPHPGVTVARVNSITPHPASPAGATWQVVTLDTAAGSKTVVCGGHSFAVGDFVAWAKPGVRLGKRRIELADRGGVPSEGMICGEAEISLGDDNQKIAVLPRSARVGQEISDLFALDGAVASGESVLAVWNARNEAVRGVLQALEKGEPELTALWRETREWSLAEFRDIYAWLEAPFDHFFYESEVGDEGKDIVLAECEKGTLIRSEGTIGADLAEYKLPFFMLLKSDGTGLYSTKDLALAKRKFDQFKIDRSVYVVDVSQSLHFQQVFATLRKLGYAQAAKCHHLAYGMVVLPDGKMSSRKGNVVPFSELKDQLVAYIRKQFLDAQLGELSEAEVHETARRVVIGTIKYGMLNQDNAKNIVFDLAEWTAPTGNTGPYLLYAYARTRSVLRELGGYDLATADWGALGHEAESELLKTLGRFEKVVATAASEYQPQLLCIYLYDLARDISRFWVGCPIMKAENPGLKNARAALADAAGRVLGKGLELLGIQTVDRM